MVHLRKTWNLSDEQIAMFMAHGFHPQGLFHLPASFSADMRTLMDRIPAMKDMSPKDRVAFARQYLDSVIKIRNMGPMRTQGSIQPGFQPAIFRGGLGSVFLFQKLGWITDINALRHFHLSKKFSRLSLFFGFTKGINLSKFFQIKT